MVNYDYRKQKTRIVPHAVECIRGAPIPLTSYCRYPKQSNVSGNALEQLEREYFNPIANEYPGTLVVLVGNNARKLAHSINLYINNKPPQPHDLFLAFNGNNILELVDLIPEVPHNCVCEPVIMKNWGWDLGMYAEAVLKYRYSKYFFVNDDVIQISGNTWLAEFEAEIQKGYGLVGVQGHYFVRTSYYGASRLFWLTFYTAILSGFVQFSDYRLRKMLPRLRAVGAIDAFTFEAIGKYFADRCKFGIGWVNSPHQFLDRNCIKYKMICASQWKQKPIPYFIDRLGDRQISDGQADPISIDYVINWARHHGIRTIR